MGLIIPSGKKVWTQPNRPMMPLEIRELYESGHVGAGTDPAARESFRDFLTSSGGNPNGDEVAYSAGYVGSSEGVLTLNFVRVIDALDENPWPGLAQEQGDCTVHGDKNSNLLTYGVEISAGLPDEVTGEVEGKPSFVAADGIRNGGLSPSPTWWWKWLVDGGGDGWSCASAAEASMKEIGIWFAAKYQDLGIDLTTYSRSLNAKYGRSGPPKNILDMGRKHLIRSGTELDGWEMIADYLAQGKGVNSCGDQAWSDTRDENGYSPTTRGSWSHSEAVLDADRRPWVAKRYKFSCLILMMNSWAVWNGGPRDIYDSAQFVPSHKRQRWIELDLVNPQTGNIMIPKGSYWIDAREMDSRYAIAKAGVSGWSKPKLPDWGGSLAG